MADKSTVALARAMYEAQGTARDWAIDLPPSGKDHWIAWAERTVDCLDQLGHRIEWIPPEG